MKPDKYGNPEHCFAHTNVGEIWVMLLEKAWAKLVGTYKKQESGFPHFALAHLTGAPTDRYQHEKVIKEPGKMDELKESFLRAKQND